MIARKSQIRALGPGGHEATNPARTSGRSGTVTASLTASPIARNPRAYVLRVDWPGRSGSLRSTAKAGDLGAVPSKRAMAGLVPRPPLEATYGPTSRAGPITRKA